MIVLPLQAGVRARGQGTQQVHSNCSRQGVNSAIDAIIYSLSINVYPTVSLPPLTGSNKTTLFVCLFVLSQFDICQGGGTHYCKKF